MQYRVFSLDDQLGKVVVSICAGIKVFNVHGRALIVGGFVRDKILGNDSVDIDIETYGVSVDEIKYVLDTLQLPFKETGKFQVLKLNGYDIDISPARRENNTGPGHTDFTCDFDLSLTPKDGALRRDFTVNSMGWDPLTNEFFDYYGGARDLDDRILRMTNVDKFKEDPLRVLRAMKFIARYGFKPDFDLVMASSDLAVEFDTISKERVFEEFRDLMVRGKYFTEAFTFLWDTGWIRLFPEFYDLDGVEQEPDWHPEGDVWVHTLHCMDAFGRIHIDGQEYDDGMRRCIVGLSVLCHDMGKPITTEIEDGRIKSKRHHTVGVGVAGEFLARIMPLDAHQALVSAVKEMVGEHMFTCAFNGPDQFSDRSIRRLSRRCSSIDLLCYVIQCDKEGRPPLVADLTDVKYLRERAVELDVYNEPPKPIMMGRHLIDIGFPPGPYFGPILDACKDAEDDGIITDVQSGLRFVIEKGYFRDFLQDVLDGNVKIKEVDSKIVLEGILILTLISLHL